MPECIDSHAHLDFATFQGELDAVLDRAWAAGLSRIIAIGSGRGSEGAPEAVTLAQRHARIFATVGVHPHEADLGVSWEGDPAAALPAEIRVAWELLADRSLASLEALSGEPRVVAIGEVGLDYHYDHSPRELQRELLRRFVRLARARRLPLVIHCREAEEDCARILREERAIEVGGVIHCFSGHPVLIELGLELGFYFGIAGIVTFPKSQALRDAVASLPRDRLLAETDCPYLAPVPHRGQRNEPAFVIEVVRAIARALHLTEQQAGELTAHNAKRLFGLPEDLLSSPGGISGT